MLYKTLLLLHVLGATVWVGGHLLLAIRILPKAYKTNDWEPLHRFEAAFEGLGLPAFALQIVTGIWLGLRYIPSLRDWFSFQSYISSHLALKCLFLALTIVLALHARLSLIPKKTAASHRSLAIHILGVTTLAVLFVWIGLGFRTGGAW